LKETISRKKNAIDEAYKLVFIHIIRVVAEKQLHVDERTVCMCLKKLEIC